MNNIIKQYLKTVRAFFPYYGKRERKYINTLKLNIEDFCGENSVSTIDQLQKEFGTPIEVVNSYYSNVDIDYVCNRIDISKKIKYWLSAILLLVLIAVMSLSLYEYQKIKLMESQMIFFEETYIE